MADCDDIRDATRQTPLRGREIAALAERQYGVVSLGQLRALGCAASTVRSRIARGSLHRVHRGVYAVGHSLLSAHGHRMAAVLACGPGAVISHRSAAAHWGIRPDDHSRIEVTSPRRAGRGRPGITVHSGTTIDPADVTVLERVACTTVARTLVDLAEVVRPDSLRRACERAESLRLFDLGEVERALARASGRRGASALAAAVEAWRPDSLFTRNELERRFVGLCVAAGIPAPEVNVWLALPEGGVEVDFLWREARIVAETDGRAVHGTRIAFERDRRRDQRLLVAGFRVARFTWRQVADRPQEVVGTLRSLVPGPEADRLGSVRVHGQRPP